MTYKSKSEKKSKNAKSTTKGDKWMRNVQSRMLAMFNKKQDSLIVIILVLIGILAIVLRLRGLGTNIPIYDETYHLTTAKAFCAGNEGKLFINGQMHGPYHRGLFITKLVQIFWLIGGTQSLFWARLPSVIAGVLTIVPIYILGSKINKKTGLVAAFLWAVAPWSIITSRLVREYSYFNLFWTGLVLGLYLCLSQIAVQIEKKKPVKISLVIASVALVVLPILYDSLTHLGTFKLIIPMYFITFLAFGFRIRPFVKKVCMRTIVAVGGIMILVAFIINKSFLSNKSWAIDFVNIFPSYSWITTSFITFFKDTRLPNFLSINLVFLAIGLIGCYCYYKKEKLNSTILIAGILSILTYFFAFHFNRFIRARYLYVFLPWLIIIESLGIIKIAEIALMFIDTDQKIKRKIQFGLIVFIIMILFNWAGLYNAIQSPFNPRYFKPETNEFAWMSTYEYASEAKAVYGEYGDDIEGTVLFTTMTYPFFWYVDDYDGDTLIYNIDPLFDSSPEIMPVPISNYFPMRFDNDFSEIESLGPNSMAENSDIINRVVSENDAGWFIVGLKPNSWWDMDFAPRDFTAGDRVVKYVGSSHGHLVYKWGFSE